MSEMVRSVSKHAFARSLQKLVPEIEERDLTTGGSGVRAQALDRTGKLLDDFSIVSSGNMIHVCNVPSPAATASLVIGQQIVDLAEQSMGLGMGLTAQGQVQIGAHRGRSL
jgi:L-2-hydroxyglutarate oxidase